MLLGWDTSECIRIMVSRIGINKFCLKIIKNIARSDASDLKFWDSPVKSLSLLHLCSLTLTTCIMLAGVSIVTISWEINNGYQFNLAPMVHLDLNIYRLCTDL